MPSDHERTAGHLRPYLGRWSFYGSNEGFWELATSILILRRSLKSPGTPSRSLTSIAAWPGTKDGLPPPYGQVDTVRLHLKFDTVRLHLQVDIVRLQPRLDTVRLQYLIVHLALRCYFNLHVAGSLMKIRSISDVSAAVRGRRLDMGLSQSALSERSGISRKWISEFESGKPTAEFALVMRVLEALGLCLELTGAPTSAILMSASGTLSASAEVSPPQDSPVDLDALLEEYQVG